MPAAHWELRKKPHRISMSDWACYRHSRIAAVEFLNTSRLLKSNHKSLPLEKGIPLLGIPLRCIRAPCNDGSPCEFAALLPAHTSLALCRQSKSRSARSSGLVSPPRFSFPSLLRPAGQKRRLRWPQQSLGILVSTEPSFPLSALPYESGILNLKAR